MGAAPWGEGRRSVGNRSRPSPREAKAAPVAASSTTSERALEIWRAAELAPASFGVERRAQWASASTASTVLPDLCVLTRTSCASSKTSGQPNPPGSHSGVLRR